MAKHGEYREGLGIFLRIVYVIVALALIAALVYMYRIDHLRRAQYKDIVKQASASETSMDISTRKNTENNVYMAQDAQEVVATQEPVYTPEPTETPEPVVITAAPEIQDPYMPDESLVDDSLAQGLDE